MRPGVKIRCIQSADELAIAIAHGASALGLVSPMPSGPGFISEDSIALIAAKVPPPTATFRLTGQHGADSLIAQPRVPAALCAVHGGLALIETENTLRKV